MADLGGAVADKFRGCLVGALVGDCLGIPFEGKEFASRVVPKPRLRNYLKRFLGSQPNTQDNGQSQFQRYSCDIAMTWNIAQSLIKNEGFNATDIAKRFAEDYFRQPYYRSYSSQLGSVFEKLQATEYSDVFDPATHRFNGMGSYGNGGAMRIAPVALFCYNKPEQQLIEMAKNSTRITHSHSRGYNGAILQSLAIRQALKSNPSSDLNIEQFLDSLISSMESVEPDQNGQRAGIEDIAKVARSETTLLTLREINCPEGLMYDENYDLHPYCTKLKIMKHVLMHPEKDLTSIEAATVFGNGVAATNSVPIALYSFLRAQKPLPDFEADMPFVRAVYLSIGSGGDTDTIATMSSAIAGAYHGIRSIPEGFTSNCEKIDNCKQMADELFATVMHE